MYAYTFGFNGKEGDDETYGEGNAYGFGARIYDPRLGRWLSLDPLMKQYPTLSPYNFTADNPIFFKDVDGREIIIFYTVKDENNNVKEQSFVYEPGMKVPNSAETNEFASNAVETLNYLHNSGTDVSKGIIDYLANNTGSTKIKESKDGSNGRNMQTGIIDWNDNKGVYTTKPNSLTGVNARPPAAGLFHEIIHDYYYRLSLDVLNTAFTNFQKGKNKPRRIY